MTDKLDEIVELLWEANQNVSTMPFIREFIAGDDVNSAYEIQRRVNERKIASGRTRVGRKVGLTNPLVQEKAGVHEPDYGTIMDDMVFHSGHEFDPSDYVAPKIEAEIAFKLSKELTSWDIETIENSIEWIAPAFELVDCHYENYKMKIADTIADNAACAGIILGDPVEYGRTDLAEARLTLTAEDREVTTGVGSNVMGNPINAVAWLARTALEQDTPLQAGELLLPGSIGLIEWWEPGPWHTAEITGVGTVTARFKEKA